MTGIAEDWDFSIELFDQEGVRRYSGRFYLRNSNTTGIIALNEILDEDFVGSAVVRCSGPCHVEGTWEFDLPKGRSRVGIAPFQDTSFADEVFVLTLSNPIANPDLLPLYLATVPGEDFALAFRAAGWGANCTVDYLVESQSVAREAFSLEPLGQRAQFAPLPEGFPGGTARIECDAPVAVLPVVQDPINGFPTVGSATLVAQPSPP